MTQRFEEHEVIKFEKHERYEWDEPLNFFNELNPGDRFFLFEEEYLKPEQKEDFHMDEMLIEMSTGNIWHFSNVISPKTITHIKKRFAEWRAI